MTQAHARSEGAAEDPRSNDQNHAPRPGGPAVFEVRVPTAGDALLTWVQIVALVGAGAWAGYTFIYEQIYLPKVAPINDSVSLQLKKVGLTAGDHPMIAVAMRVSVTNSSSRLIYLLPTAWVVRGIKLQYDDPSDVESFDEGAAAILNKGDYVERYSMFTTYDLVATGRLFDDKLLNPKETIARTFIVHIPQNRYDEIEAVAFVPNVDVPNGYSYKYSIQRKLLSSIQQDVFTSTLCRQDAHGACIPISSYKGYALETSEAQLSLP